MLNETISIDQAIAFLNELLALDEDAILSLIGKRVACEQSLALHPTVQTGVVYLQEHGYHHNVGFLGVINGLFGTIEGGAREGWGPIALKMGPNEPARFERTEES